MLIEVEEESVLLFCLIKYFLLSFFKKGNINIEYSEYVECLIFEIVFTRKEIITK